jgi:hypothetical protein
MNEKLNVDEKLSEAEHELAILSEFVKAAGWEFLRRKWQPLVDAAIGYALAGNVEDRGFAAGKANGLKYFLQYPEKRIKILESEIKKLRSLR